MCSKEASGGRATRLRVNAQLIDAETDAHLWAERFDGDTGNLFAVAKRHHKPDRACD